MTYLRLAFFGFIALVASVAVASAQESANTQIVAAYYAAINGGDVDTAMTFLSDDVVFINPTGTYVGRDEVRASIVAGVEGKVTIDVSNFADDKGRVTYDYVVKENGNAVEVGTTGLTIVEGGKIVFDGTTDSVALWKR